MNRVELFNRLIEQAEVPCEIKLPSGETLRYGATPPKFRATIRSNRALRGSFDEFSLAKAYVEGEIDIEGDMLSVFDLRARLKDKARLFPLLNFWLSLFLRIPARVNRKAIQHHYSFGDDFHLGFIDSKYRVYSHGLFDSDDETLEQASERKLETMYEALELKPGMRLLDIGAGWGPVPQYCGNRGVHVTSLTLASDSHRFIRDLIRKQDLPAEVYLQDFLDHRPEKPYDAVVILGVIEHIPYYRRFFRQLWDCLRPGGLFYLDASASKEKYDISTFTRHYIYRGTHTFMCLQDVIQELLYHGLQLIRVRQESHDYYLTMRKWAERFDADRARIIERWGEPLYRAWRIYLWGGCHALRSDILQAYHLVARRLADPGPRPGFLRRTKHFIRGLA